VKQNKLGEYAREKQNIQVYKVKQQLSLKPRQITSSPSNQAMWMANTKLQTQEGNNQNMRFLNAEDHTPPKAKIIKQAPPQTKATQTKRQTQSKTPTPPEDQIILDQPQDKHGPLKQ
jgi:hypothetical protein